MKKIKITTVLLVMALALTACGSKKENANLTPTPVATQPAQSTNTPEPTPTDIPEQTPTDNPDVNGGEPEITYPEMSDELNSIYEAVNNAYGEYTLSKMSVDTETIEQLLGIPADFYDFAVAEMPMMSGHVDRFFAFHAANGKFDDIVTALNNYRNMLIEDTLQYPMNVPKIQASKVYTNGDYAFFIILGAYPEDDSIYTEEQLVTLYEEYNDKAVKAIDSVLNK